MFALFTDRSLQGYTSLNRIQSIVYPTAYQSNENMLVCGEHIDAMMAEDPY